MKSTEINELTLRELEERIDNEKTFFIKMKLNHTVSPLDNPMKLRDIRRNIARLQTELRRRQLTDNKQN